MDNSRNGNGTKNKIENKNKKKKRMLHLGPKVGVVQALLLVLSIALVVQLSVSMFRKLTMNMLQNQCVSGTNMLAYELENYAAPDADMTKLLDDLKEQLGCEFTIFKGDERAFTTIMQDGERVVGTKLSEELADLVLEHMDLARVRAFLMRDDHEP